MNDFAASPVPPPSCPPSLPTYLPPSLPPSLPPTLAPSLIDKANNIITSPMKMAEILSAQYSSVYSKPKEPMQDADIIFPDYMDETKLHDITFTEVDVIKAIDELSPTAAAGPDRYPALLLKNCKHALASVPHMEGVIGLWTHSPTLEDGSHYPNTQREEQGSTCQLPPSGLDFTPGQIVWEGAKEQYH